MPKFIELMTTENKIEIRISSMFIMKAFVIRKTNFNSIKYAPSRFLFCIHVLFRKCIL